MRLFEAGEADFWCSFRVIRVVWGSFHGPSCRCKLPYYKFIFFFFQVAVLRTGKLPYSKCFLFLIICQSNQNHYK